MSFGVQQIYHLQNLDPFWILKTFISLLCSSKKKKHLLGIMQV